MLFFHEICKEYLVSTKEEKRTAEKAIEGTFFLGNLTI